MTCRRYQDQMAERLAGAAAADADFDAHLARCADCATEYRELQETLALAARERPPVDPGPRLNEFWARLEPALDEVDRERTRRRGWGWPVWGALAAAAVLALALIGLNRGTETPPEPAEPAVDDRLTAFFDRAEPFLLSLVNVAVAEDDELLGETVARDRVHAARLADEAGALQDALQTAPLGQRHLLGDIELLMLQVANLRESDYPSGVALVRNFMDRRIILFKLSLIESRSQLEPQT